MLQPLDQSERALYLRYYIIINIKNYMFLFFVYRLRKNPTDITYQLETVDKSKSDNEILLNEDDNQYL
jgi:hypothetical protein